MSVRDVPAPAGVAARDLDEQHGSDGRSLEVGKVLNH